MKARKIKENIYWVGAIDWNVRNFHGYLTQRGTTYNAYLIIDEKVTLIDAVKASHKDEMLKRIADVIDPSKIDVVVSNHVEMDHSGAIPDIMELNPNATVVASKSGEKGLKRHYKKDWNFHIVSTGDTFNLGKTNLQFVLTPMVHWPDNMLAYMPEEKLLFSNDSLGQHYASSERFDHECQLDVILNEAKKYYANIVLPYSNQVRKELEIAATLDIEMIAPSHGVIWTKHINAIIEKYKKWSSNKTIKKATIVYDTMWKSTESIALKVYEAFEEKGYQIELFNLQNVHMSDIMAFLIDSEYIAVGSPTLNKSIMPSVAGFLMYLKGLSPGGRKAIVFGSYGWGDKTIPEISRYMEESSFQIVNAMKMQFVPDESELEEYKKELLGVIE